MKRYRIWTEEAPRPMFSYIRGEQMTDLEKPLYKAAQRAMESIWFKKHTAPIEEAVAWAQDEYGYGSVTISQVQEVIANFINLLTRRISKEPESFAPFIDKAIERFRATIIYNQPRLQPLQQEAASLSAQVEHKQREIAQFKSTMKQLESLDRQLKNRKRKLEAAEEGIREALKRLDQTERERLEALHRIHLDIIDSLARSAEKDLAEAG